MKLRRLFYSNVMVVALGAALTFTSCGEENGEPPLTFESDAVAFCLANPNDPDCCKAEHNLDCYCTTGDNATTDTQNCCLKEYNLECFCTENPDDAACAQNFGVGNGLGLLIDFESGTSSFATDFYNPSGLATFDGDANIAPVEGDHYFSLVLETDNENKAWHDFKYDPNEGATEATIDLSTMSNPTINFWVNSGPNEADSLGFTVALWGKDDGAGGSDQTDYAAHPLFKASTGGEWKLMSFPIKDMTVQNGWDGGANAIDMTVKYKLVKFAFMPESWHIPGRYVCHVDAISITDGPLEQLPWVK